MSQEEYKLLYEEWERQAKSGRCSWQFAMAQVAVLSIEFGQAQERQRALAEQRR